jgi:ankyrin repeat protein
MTAHDTAQARRLAKQGSQLNTRDQLGNSPLICAVRSGHFDIAMMLIKCNANVNVQNAYGFSALHYLCCGDASYSSAMARSCARNATDPLEMFSELVRRGAAFDANVVFSFTPSPRDWGDCDESDDIVESCFSSPDGLGRTFRAIRFLPRALQLCPDLVRSHGVLNFYRMTSWTGTLLHWIVAHTGQSHFPPRGAPRNRDPESESEIETCLTIMRQLISLGVEVDWRAPADASPRFQPTALAIAVEHGFSEAVALLLQAGADPNSLGLGFNHRLQDCTLLMHACHRYSIPCMKALIAASANVNAVVGGRTALTVLLHNDGGDASPQALRLLIQASADCNALADGDSALALSIKNKSKLGIIELDFRRSAVQLHVEFTETEAMILLRNGALVTQKEVHLAVDKNLPNVARHLLCCGGCFSETLAYINRNSNKAFLRAFLYPSAVLVCYCQRLTLRCALSSQLPRVSCPAKLPPLPRTSLPQRVRALCIGALLLHLVQAFAKAKPGRLQARVQRWALPRELLPVVLRCTSLAAAQCFAADKNAQPGFVQIDWEFGVDCGYYGYCWFPERQVQQSLHSATTRDEAAKCACSLL